MTTYERLTRLVATMRATEERVTRAETASRAALAATARVLTGDGR